MKKKSSTKNISLNQKALSDYIFIGIDPGKSGGLAALGPTGNIIESIPMPSTDKEIFDWFHKYSMLGNCFAIIERVHSMPSQSAQSTFTFGVGLGHLEMALTGNEISYEYVMPLHWQKTLGITQRKKSESKSFFKNRLLNKSIQLFPKLAIWKEPKSKGKQLSICDAILIAEFNRRKFLGISK